MGKKLLSKPPLPRVVPGKWIEFEDAHGTGFAQPDFFLLGQRSLLLVECKLTQTETAEVQLLHLYSPLLAHIFPSHTIACVQVCKNLRHIPEYEVESLDEVLEWPPGRVATLHWIG